MSFSTSFSAQKHGAINLDAARETVKKSDAGWEQTPGQVIVGAIHQKQIDAAEKALAFIAEQFPGETLVGNVYGHANADGTGNVGISYGFEKPLPQA